VTQKKVILLTVRQAKGLEFDSVFVFDDDMNKNECYIAYSRALSELYIVLTGSTNYIENDLFNYKLSKGTNLEEVASRV